MTDRPKALITRYFIGDAAARLADVFDVEIHDDTRPLDAAELRARLSDVHAVVSYGDEFDADTLKAAPNLQVIADFWDGRGVDAAAAAAQGVVVASAGGSEWIIPSEAEHAFALLLASARRIPEADRFVKDARWRLPEQSVRELAGTGLAGKTVGVINGSRRAGVDLVKRLQGWDVTVLHSGEVRSPEVEAAGATPATREELLRTSDFVVLLHGDFSNPAPDITADELALMRPQAHLVSITLGRAIDEAAVLDALESGRLAGLAVDKLRAPFDSPDALASRDDVIVTPHADGALVAERAHMFDELVDACLAVIEGGRPRHVVTP